MDELNSDRSNQTNFARARNRLVLGLYGVSVAAYVILSLLRTPALEFASLEAELSGAQAYWSQVQLRKTTLDNNRNVIFYDALRALLSSICIPKNSPDRKDFGTPSKIGGNKCTSEHARWTFDHSSIVGKTANCLSGVSHTQLVQPGQFAVRQCMESGLGTKLIEYIDQDYKRETYLNILQSWWAWPTRRQWLVNGVLEYYPDRNGVSYSSYDYSYVESPQHLGPQTWFRKQYVFDTQMAKSRLLSANEDQAATIIASSYAEAKQMHDAHLASNAGGQLQLGGATIRMPQLLDFVLPVLCALAILAVIYIGKAQREFSNGTKLTGRTGQNEWFPRLGEPSDPLGPPLPKGDAWLTRFIWLGFLVLPLDIALFDVWARFDEHAFVRRGTKYWFDESANLWRLFQFLVIWWCSISFAARPTRRNLGRPWFAICMMLSTGFAIFGAAWTASSNGIQVLADGTVDIGRPYSILDWVFAATFWLIPAIWATIWIRWRIASRFTYVMATLMTLVTWPGYGEMLLIIWRQWSN